MTHLDLCMLLNINLISKANTGMGKPHGKSQCHIDECSYVQYQCCKLSKCVKEDGQFDGKKMESQVLLKIGKV